jgi:dTDP-4-dehydrorhamnose reductase
LKKILITGVSGYLAPYLCKALLHSGDQDIYGIYNSTKPDTDGIELIKCNLTDTAKLERIFDNIKPEILYHLASVTPTRITTEDESYISRFNGGVSGELARMCSKHDALMIYTSTDLVYKAGRELTEDSSPLEPLTAYAKTKLEGEEAVKNFAKKYLILRTSLVYGFTLSSYTSFFDTAFSNLKAGKQVRAFTDQYRNPLYSEDAAAILAELPGKYKINDTINFCGSEYISRYDMCIGMCDVFGLDRSLVIPSSTDEFTTYPMVKELGLSTEKRDKYGLKTDSYIKNLHKSIKYKS